MVSLSTPVAFLTPSLSSSFRSSLALQLLNEKVKIKERAKAKRKDTKLDATLCLNDILKKVVDKNECK